MEAFAPERFSAPIQTKDRDMSRTKKLIAAVAVAAAGTLGTLGAAGVASAHDYDHHRGDHRDHGRYDHYDRGLVGSLLHTVGHVLRDL
jgi:hypothetical protein